MFHLSVQLLIAHSHLLQLKCQIKLNIKRNYVRLENRFVLVQVDFFFSFVAGAAASAVVTAITLRNRMK